MSEKRPTVAGTLSGSTILVTGAAGFVGTAILLRLLTDPTFGGSQGVKKILALIRGNTVEEATLRLPEVLRPFTEGADAKLTVLNGDCAKPGFGLSGQLLETVQKAEIVIHAAGDTRFTLSLEDAVSSISDLGYMGARFSLVNYKTKTHIHLSTSFVAWFLAHNSIIREDFLQDGLDVNLSKHSQHVNTYLHAKTFSEGCVNALFSAQAGRGLNNKVARILRLATIGPSVAFPRPGWGSGHPSSPVCAALAAHVVTDKAAIAYGAGLDVIPIDIAVNQILALTAAAHATHQLDKHNIASPKHPLNPVNAHGVNVPCYNVAAGLPASHNVWMETLNNPTCKIAEPYVPEKNLVKVYKPFIEKIVDFDTSRARQVLGIQLYDDARLTLANTTKPTAEVKSQLTRGSLTSTPKNARKGWLAPMARSLWCLTRSAKEDRASGSSATYSDSMLSAKEDTEEHFAMAATTVVNPAMSAASMPSGFTAHNLDRLWSDPVISSGALEIDVAKAVASRWGALGGVDSPGWIGYLRMIRDEMQNKGPRKDWISYVD